MSVRFREFSPRAALLALAWTAAITAGAVFLHYFPPQHGWLRSLANSEAVHVVVHLLLYGLFALLALRAFGRVRWAVLLTVAAGALQEAAQTVPFGVRPAGPELFDLAVDLVAALGAMALARWRQAPRLESPDRLAD
jgi:hypothetical protein